MGPVVKGGRDPLKGCLKGGEGDKGDIEDVGRRFRSAFNICRNPKGRDQTTPLGRIRPSTVTMPVLKSRTCPDSDLGQVLNGPYPMSEPRVRWLARLSNHQG